MSELIAKQDLASRMPAFDAVDDKSLLLLVGLFDRNGLVDWNKVLYHMGPTSKTVEDLQDRLQYLTLVDTSCLAELPATYVAGTCLTKSVSSKSTVYKAIDYIFQELSRNDVLQPVGKPHLNVGEIAPIGVTEILNTISLTSQDCFVDVGSGTGSVLAQVVLESTVGKAIGLEIQSDLATRSRNTIESAQEIYSRLQDVKVLTGDVKALSNEAVKQLSVATVVFCNNLVFRSEDILGLYKCISNMHHLRAVLLTQRHCTRRSIYCTDEYSEKWKEECVILARTCWRNNPLEVYMYTRKEVIDKSLLDILLHL